MKALIGHLKRSRRLAGVLLAGLLLGGCATGSTIASRKQERYAAYEALSPEMRRLVDQGQIKVGMSMDAVYIAWGPPGQVTEGESEAGRTTTWAYYGIYQQEFRTWGWHRMYYTYSPVTYVQSQAVFTNGIVKQWQTFPSPGY